MSKEPKICPYCNLEITSGQESTTTPSGVEYHNECHKNLEIDNWVATIEKKYPTTDAKLARVISQNIALMDSAEKQERHLATIKTVIVLVMVLSIIGMLIQSCGVLGY